MDLPTGLDVPMKTQLHVVMSCVLVACHIRFEVTSVIWLMCDMRSACYTAEAYQGVPMDM